MSSESFQNAKIELVKTPVFKVYLFFTTSVMLMEQVIVGFPPHGTILNLQIAVLAASSFLLISGIFLVLNFYPGDSEVSGFLPKLMDILRSEFLLEIVGVIIGWVFLFILPGLAVLRCFRAFRLFWWFELLAPEYGDDYNPAEDIMDFWIVTRSSVKYLKKLGLEIFTAKSRGGAVILAMFFYVTYLFAVVFWREKGYIVTPDNFYENGYVCGTLPLCFLTMMRLALYDGTGLDYFTAVALEGGKDSFGFGTLGIIYMVFTAMILLNGLIGIFGHAFADDDEGDETAEEERVIEAEEILGELFI